LEDQTSWPAPAEVLIKDKEKETTDSSEKKQTNDSNAKKEESSSKKGSILFLSFPFFFCRIVLSLI
jgi:hypothetical protein